VSYVKWGYKEHRTHSIVVESLYVKKDGFGQRIHIAYMLFHSVQRWWRWFSC